MAVTKRGGKDTASSSDGPGTALASSSPKSRRHDATTQESNRIPKAQSPSNSSGNDIEHGVPTRQSKSGNSDHQTYLSAREKADFNARLEERRRQRRDHRTRRRQRQELHRVALGIGPRGGSVYYRSKSFCVVSCIFVCILCGWLFTFLYLAAELDLQGDGQRRVVASPMQLMRKNKGKIFGSIKEAIRDLPITKRFRNRRGGDDENYQLLKGHSTDVIDMRVMNYELPFDNPNGGKWTQGWDVKPVELKKSKPLKIFVVPHSHCDPGWIKTFDDYFQSQTRQILTTVFESLVKDPNRKFIWAEISYFEWWWREQDESTKESFRRLLQNKQFEFVTGGWVQPDEANTQLYAMEIQLEEGHDFIRETFGEQYIPKYGWSIDPFGYSPTMAYLLKKHGFEAMLIQRVHYAVKKELALHKNLEFMWRQTWDETGEFDIFTHVMPFYSYDIPHTCGPDPSVCCQFDFTRVMHPHEVKYVAKCPWKIDAQRITEDNLEERSMLLLDQYRKKANLYRTNVVLAPLGDDFRYQGTVEANLQFENYQKIFDYINAEVDNVEISFGTLSEYFKTVMAERPFSPPLLKGSFFTYADREEDYWSGYFTSRIFDKALDRKLERVLYAASSMGATKKQMMEPRRALSLFQHHDGVTGTATVAVVEDYAKRIHGAIAFVQDWIRKNLPAGAESKLLSEKAGLEACWQSTAPRGLSQNLCEKEGGGNSNIIVYNPLLTDQSCGSVVVPGRTIAHATLPCETPGPLPPPEVESGDHQQPSGIKFDPNTGLMLYPVREEWMVWKVTQGGAYLFFPGELGSYNELDLDIREGGSIVITKHWKRTVVERKLSKNESGGFGGVAIDFVYETNLQTSNEEWFARFTSPDIKNQGIFHTDLNGYNFDTHHFRSDMPIQSQVFPMPTLASIEDSNKRMTVLSEHAQGAASLEESAIDVWLDRRLAQDDGRGLESGVMDNVPTRTRLRVVLEERTPEASKAKEFEITPFCKLQWKELNHPLELFGTTGDDETIPSIELASVETRKAQHKKGMIGSDYVGHEHVPSPGDSPPGGSCRISAVYMVHDRVEYLKRAMDSLRDSDYPKDAPVVISHDGHVREMVDYVESLKQEFNIVQIFHPYSCAEHPNEFPMDDPKLNENFEGDTYGNPRDGKITCCKHHFSWLINTVFDMEETKDADGFLFLEEDYIVAPTVYQTIQKGFAYIDTKNRRDDFFGIGLDPSNGYAYVVPKGVDWVESKFVTGPVVIRREIFSRIRAHAKEFCTWDDYNWDWSIVHLMAMEYIPFRVLVPTTLQAAHIGLEGGMHEHEGDGISEKQLELMQRYFPDEGGLKAFHADVGVPHIQRIRPPEVKTKGFGGWGHPADHEHCIKVFEGAR